MSAVILLLSTDSDLFKFLKGMRPDGAVTPGVRKAGEAVCSGSIICRGQADAAFTYAGLLSPMTTWSTGW